MALVSIAACLARSTNRSHARPEKSITRIKSPKSWQTPEKRKFVSHPYHLAATDLAYSLAYGNSVL